MPLLELRDVDSFYGSVQALKGITLHVDEHEIVTLLGANGAGKSTTLRTISGLNTAARGEIVFTGQRIEALGPEAIVRLGIAHVPEGRRIFPGLTVAENIMLGASSRTGLKRSAMAGEVEQMFDIFPDLRRLSKALGWSLSGGQQQMLAVARGLMAAPKLLLLDEPSLGLAPIIVQQLFAVIRKIRERGTTILLVEQNANMALNASDYGYVLENGRIVMEDTCARLREKDDIKEFYLGMKEAGVRGERRWKKRKNWR
jgi:branched-chain amino acid transport system ATP-binding protein